MTISKGLTQAYQVQDIAYSAIQVLKEQWANGRIDSSTIADLHKLASTWSSAQERIAFHRRVPSPGSLRPEARKAKRPRRAAPLTATVAPATPAPSMSMQHVDNATATSDASTSGDTAAK